MAYTWYTFWHFIRGSWSQLLPHSFHFLLHNTNDYEERERGGERERESVPWLGTSAVRQIKFKVIVSAGPARWRRLLSDAPNKSYDFRFLLVLHFFPPFPPSLCMLVLPWFMAKNIWQFTVDSVMLCRLFVWLSQSAAFLISNSHRISKNDYKFYNSCLFCCAIW